MRRWGAGALGRWKHQGREVVHLTTFALVTLFSAAAPQRLGAQFRVHAQAIPLVTRAWHTPGDETRTEFALTQPAVMLEWSTRDPGAEMGMPMPGTRLSLRLTLDGEGVTIPDGELTPGAHGEGFYDRRHPHTYVHEVMAIGSDLLGTRDGALDLTLAVGKGFVAFGSDDPMSRPVVRYPVNHHLAQILERGMLLGAATYGPASLEATWFNGDEPTKPADWPNVRERGLDSRALRFTLRPARGVEAQYSWAQVRSPEHRPGAGSDQRKRAASLRWTGPLASRPASLLAEWGRTEEAGGFFRYSTALVEGAVSLGRHRPYARVERTDRPEELRTTDPFRSVRPHADASTIGTTRWRILTLGYGVSLLTARGHLEARPFVEGSLASVRMLTGVFDPEVAYGADVLPSITVGVRMDWGGMSSMRMGRYLGSSDHSEHTDHH